MACAAKDVSGVRGTDVFVTAGRIVELQGLNIGWRMGAVADAVRSRMGSAPYFGCGVFDFVPVQHHHLMLPYKVAATPRTRHQCWLHKQRGAPFISHEFSNGCSCTKQGRDTLF